MNEREPGRPPWRVEAVWALASAGTAVGLAGLALQLWRAHLSVPLQVSRDALLNLMVVRSIELGGWFQHAPLLNAPFGQDLTGYPSSVGDTWHLLALKALLPVTGSAAAAVTIYYLLGFTLAAATGYLALREVCRFRGVSMALAVAYSLAPFHFLQGETHLFLSEYWAVPLSCALAVRLLTGRPVTGSLRRTLTTVGVVVLVGGTGLYFAAFTALLLAVSGVLRGVQARRLRPVLTAAVLCTGLLTCLLLAAVPNLLHTRPPGAGPVAEARNATASELYGLRLENLFFPLPEHRFPPLAAVRRAAADNLVAGEDTETLGLLAAGGLAMLGGALLLRGSGPATRLERRLLPLAALAMTCGLTATVGGVSGAAAALGVGQLRAWNRISIVLAFLALAAVAILANHLGTYRRRPVRLGSRASAVAATLAVLALSFLDQTTPAMVPAYRATAQAWHSDAAYFSQLERTFGAGAAVFQLPYVPFPENPPVADLTDYDHLRGYLHSRLRWSYGGVKGENTVWQPPVLALGVTEGLPRIAAAGFSAVYVNRRGFPDHGQQVLADLTAVLHAPALVDSSGELITFDLRGYRAQVLAERTADLTRATLLRAHPLRTRYLAGFYGAESDRGGRWHWARGHAQLVVSNPLPTPRTVRLATLIETGRPGAKVTVTFAGRDRVLTTGDLGTPLDVVVPVPPGGLTIDLSTDSPRYPTTADPRDLRLRLTNTWAVDDALLPAL